MFCFVCYSEFTFANSRCCDINPSNSDFVGLLSFLIKSSLQHPSKTNFCCSNLQLLVHQAKTNFLCWNLRRSVPALLQTFVNLASLGGFLVWSLYALRIFFRAETVDCGSPSLTSSVGSLLNDTPYVPSGVNNLNRTNLEGYHLCCLKEILFKSKLKCYKESCSSSW